MNAQRDQAGKAICPCNALSDAIRPARSPVGLVLFLTEVLVTALEALCCLSCCVRLTGASLGRKSLWHSAGPDSSGIRENLSVIGHNRLRRPPRLAFLSIVSFCAHSDR
jgi:hypothetical protein